MRVGDDAAQRTQTGRTLSAQTVGAQAPGEGTWSSPVLAEALRRIVVSTPRSRLAFPTTCLPLSLTCFRLRPWACSQTPRPHDKATVAPSGAGRCSTTARTHPFPAHRPRGIR